MAIGDVETLLAVCAAVNYAVLIVWFCAFAFARRVLYRLHARWFEFDVQTFDTVHYAGMAFYKLLVLVFNVAPLVALAVLRSRG